MNAADRTSAWGEAERILCVRLDNLGDVIMTTPAMRALKESVPGRHLTLLAAPAGAAAAPYIPEVDDVLTYAAPWVKQGDDVGADASDEVIDILYGGQYDAAVIFTVYSQSALPAALTCWLARIPLRLAHVRENPYQLLTDWVPDPEPHALLRHEAQRQLDLVASIGCTTANLGLSFQPTLADAVTLQRKLENVGIEAGTPYVVVHPGASAASRRYPIEQFAEALQGLAAETPHALVVTGSQQEMALGRVLADALPDRARTLAGTLTLGELGAAIANAELLIANNTGPAHIAAAVGTPVVDLYALTNPQHTPWQVDSRVLYHDVPCRFCYRSVCTQGHHECLRRISPDRVTRAALELLARHRDITSVACAGEAA